jgi:hypothetical protein
MSSLTVQSAVLGALGLGLIGCIATRSEDHQGATHFITSVASNPSDFAPTALPHAGGSVAISMMPVAGSNSGFVPPPPPPTSMVGGAVPTTSAPGAPTVPVAQGRAGAGAAIGGGAAGAPAAPGLPTSLAGSMSVAMAGSAAPPSVGMLTVDFKTVTQGGLYSPANVGAVWIETGSGMFVKTLEKWGSIRAGNLTRWNTASGGWGSIFGGGNTADQMDAVSKATQRGYGAHHEMWAMKDAMGKVVADGKYNLVIELCEDEFRPGASADVAFEKGPEPQKVMAPDKAPYTGLTLSYQP